MSEKKLNNPFAGRVDGLVFEGRRFDKPADIDVFEPLVKDVVKKTGPGEDDYVIEHKVIVGRRYNRQDFIQDQSDDIGIMNILKKMARTGQSLDDLPYAAKEGFVDLTALPSNYAELEKFMADAKSAWDSLPEDLKAGMNYETFVNTMNAEKIIAYAKAKASEQAQVAAEVKKEGE